MLDHARSGSFATLASVPPCEPLRLGVGDIIASLVVHRILR